MERFAGAALSGAGALTLAVETATAARSAALVCGARVLAEASTEAVRGGADVLGQVDEVLQRACVRLEEVELFAAAEGPGSFTGLRAGLATVKAFAATLGRPAIGVRTLHAVARAAGPAPRVLALIPAGRGEFFAQCLSVGGRGEVSELSEARHAAARELLAWAEGARGGPLVWAGAGAQELCEAIGESARRLGLRLLTPEEAVWAGGAAGASCEAVWTLARATANLAPHVAALALLEHGRGGAFPAEGLKAFYVRASDAELKGP